MGKSIWRFYGIDVCFWITFAGDFRPLEDWTLTFRGNLMNKVNTKQYTESFEQWFRDVEAGDDPNWSSPPYLSQEWYQYLSRRELALGAWNKALEVALPILEQQQEVMQVPAYYIVYHPNPDPHEYDDREHSHCGSIHLARRLAGEIGGSICPVYIGEKLAQQERAEGEWIEWAGGLQPVCDGTLLDIKFRDNEVGANNLAENWIWDHAGDSDDIIAYRIIPASRNGV